jgi:hypothetical protein
MSKDTATMKAPSGFDILPESLANQFDHLFVKSSAYGGDPRFVGRPDNKLTAKEKIYEDAMDILLSLRGITPNGCSGEYVSLSMITNIVKEALASADALDSLR